MSNYKDKEFLQIIDKGIEHCNRGDVEFAFSQILASFRGDELSSILLPIFFILIMETLEFLAHLLKLY